MSEKTSNKLLKAGISGTVIAALCCFTPILVILLGMVGLSGVVGYLDRVLLPALLVFVGITIYALAKRKQGCCAENDPPAKAELK